VVTTGAEGTSDVVQHGVTGHCYDASERDGAINAIRQLLSDSAYQARLREQARLDVEQWGWAAARRQLKCFYRDVIRREHELPMHLEEHSARRASIGDICEKLHISHATFRRHKRMLTGNGHEFRTSRIVQTSAAVQARMVQRQIDNLPINGRNWANLLSLIPGATDSGTSDQRTVRFAGHGRDDNNSQFR
jgi:AraC-like DNA-binding protein